MTIHPLDNASLRIYSNTISSEQITALLQALPTDCYEVGNPISRNRPTTKLRTNSLWLLEVKPDAQQGLEDCIQKILDFCEAKTQALDALRDDCGIDIFCGLSIKKGQGGVLLQQAVIARLALLRIDIFFDIYSA